MYIIKTILAVIALSSFQVQATPVTLEFSNGWTVNFDLDNESEDIPLGADFNSFVQIAPVTIEGTGNNFTPHPDWTGLSYVDATGIFESEPTDDIEIGTATPQFAQANNLFIEGVDLFNGEDIVGALSHTLDSKLPWETLTIDSAGNEVDSTAFLTKITQGSVNPVPVPGAIWLFGTSLVGLVARKRVLA
jgi:hypothetical protein